MTRLVLWLATASPLALAEGPSAAPHAPAGALGPFMPLILIFGVFYFLIIRPQQKKQKEHDKFLTELKRGDMVVTNAGIVGTVKTISEKFVTLEVDDGVCLKILRNQVAESAANLREEPKGKPATQPA